MPQPAQREAERIKEDTAAHQDADHAFSRQILPSPALSCAVGKRCYNHMAV
jgi:hypothetical protein